MQITYACPACDGTVTLDDLEGRDRLACPGCGAGVPVPAGAIVREAGGSAGRVRLTRCLVCPSHELFTRKDFPQRLGLAIVIGGFAASCVTWAWQLLLPTFGILFATALVDVLLYLFMPECLTCYRCQACYRGDLVAADHGGFDLETHEKHRQGKARAAALAREAAGRNRPTAADPASGSPPSP